MSFLGFTSIWRYTPVKYEVKVQVDMIPFKVVEIFYYTIGKGLNCKILYDMYD